MQTNFLTRRRMQRMLGIRYQEVSTFCRRLQRFHNLLPCPMNMTFVRISFQFLCYLRCPYIMWSRVYNGRAFVCLSVPRSTAAAAVGGFVAERPVDRRYQSIAAGALRAPCCRRAGAQQQMRIESRRDPTQHKIRNFSKALHRKTAM